MPKHSKFVKMPVQDYLNEHRKLIKILEKGNKKATMAEAKSQFREVKKSFPSFTVI
jgi:hypothetical protein